MARRNARKDSNQDEIVNALRGCGFHVDITHQLGSGFPDIVVTGLHRKSGDLRTVLVEIKNGRGKLSRDEKRFFDKFPEGGPLIIARQPEDVLSWFGAI